ncbi:MAG: transcription antitermination factor NusB [Clostridia bacterium]|nr:transcription antitermination factor NusB [Clostridia bacterium]
MSRKNARDCAFKLIFEIPFHDGITPDERVEQYFEYGEYEDINTNDKEYISVTVCDCFNNIEAIDKKISDSLENWRLDRLSKIDLSILRLAAAEILFNSDIPFRVSVNEAVELAKTYSEDNSPSFVNGVLSKFEG